MRKIAPFIFLIIIEFVWILHHGVFGSLSVAKDISSNDSLSSIRNTPRIQFEKKGINFGEVDRDTTVVGQISFQNTGTTPLEILAIKSLCDCITTKPVSVVVEAGSSGGIEVTLDTSKYTGSTQEKQIALYTNDPMNPVILFAIHASFKEDFEIYPRHLQLGEFLRWQEATETITVSPIGIMPFQVTSVDSTSKHFIPTLTEEFVGNGRKHYVISVRLRTEGVFKRRRLGHSALPKTQIVGGRIQVFTGSPNQPVIEVPVTARVTDS